MAKSGGLVRVLVVLVVLVVVVVVLPDGFLRVEGGRKEDP